MAKILIVGGAGFIGTHMAAQLLATGHEIVVYDKQASSSLATHFPQAVTIEGSISETDKLSAIFKQHNFIAVMHFAAYIEVGESVNDPEKYYDNNVANTLALLAIMRQHQVNYFIFSSTAAVYGEPQYLPIDTQHPKLPLNPYGRSKWIVEQILQDYDQAYGLRYATLRYFNAAGADPDSRFGESHQPETHLIPIVLRAANGRRQHITIFGNDYDTEDGTCVRDYIHVCDLCDAHALALDYLQRNHQSATFNLGNGQGFSIKQVLQTAEQVTGKKIPTLIGSRRPGDPARLVAESSTTMKILNWQPRYADLTAIIEHAWQWEKKQYG